jgi:hypothetical protein
VTVDNFPVALAVDIVPVYRIDYNFVVPDMEHLVVAIQGDMEHPVDMGRVGDQLDHQMDCSH